MTMYRSSREAECTPLQAIAFFFSWLILAGLIWNYSAAEMVPTLASFIGSFLGFWIMVFLSGLASVVLLSAGLIGLCLIIELVDG